jgi:signal transduction histidine kinase
MWGRRDSGRPAAVVAAVILLGAAVARPALAVVLLSAATAGWLSVAAWRWPTVHASLYYPVLLVLTTALVWVNPYAVFGSWIVAVHAFLLFEGRWAFIWVAIGAALMTIAQGHGVTPAPALISLIVPLIVAGLYLGRESEERRRLNEELTALQDRLVEQARTAGVQDERGRLARDIHDTLAQDLSAAVALLEGAVADGVTERRVVQARDLTRAGLIEARRSVLALAPQPLTGATLPTALDALVRSFAARTGIDGSFTADEPVDLDAEVETAFLRVGQSALANVAQHAAANRVRVTLSYLDDAVVLDVRDDGRGFESRGFESRGSGGGESGSGRRDGLSGFGLEAMRRRIGDLGGSLEVETGPGVGTAVRAEVPIG